MVGLLVQYNETISSHGSSAQPDPVESVHRCGPAAVDPDHFDQSCEDRRIYLKR